jgi:phosphoribosyl-AMP cyclohydrolase / phosphoribosyl-ATP pyrophosphohydrolase
MNNINFEKGGGLVPVIIQHYTTLQVLMLGYMNQEAYKKTVAENRVTFFSRTKNRLWTKGETSGNFLLVKNIQYDCDQDALLVLVSPLGPVCHTGTTSCFNETTAKGFIYELEQTIHTKITGEDESSYTRKLYRQGINKMAQKLGEEAVELVIEAKDSNNILFKNEAGDLLYHFLILLAAKNISLTDVEMVLQQRSTAS